MVSKGKDNLDRWEKVKSRTSHMDAVRESYNPIVPSKQANEGLQPCQPPTSTLQPLPSDLQPSSSLLCPPTSDLRPLTSDICPHGLPTVLIYTR